MSPPVRTIGVIGGSGISRLLAGEVVKTHPMATPWGPPSGAIEERNLGEIRVLFLPRHGVGHMIPPHRVNYRANIDALVTMGAERIVALNSVGSLQPELPPGQFVLPEQFVDFTRSRPTTFYDGGRVYHVSMADPFCPELTRLVATSGEEVGSHFVVGKTYVCVEGPRFSTRAESRFFRSFADIIGMTVVPEATLARERAICYVCLAMVTDYDVWQPHAVEAEDIGKVMGQNAERIQRVLQRLLPKLSSPRTCACAKALDTAAI